MPSPLGPLHHLQLVAQREDLIGAERHETAPHRGALLRRKSGVIALRAELIGQQRTSSMSPTCTTFSVCTRVRRRRRRRANSGSDVDRSVDVRRAGWNDAGGESEAARRRRAVDVNRHAIGVRRQRCVRHQRHARSRGWIVFRRRAGDVSDTIARLRPAQVEVGRWRAF